MPARVVIRTKCDCENQLCSLFSINGNFSGTNLGEPKIDPLAVLHLDNRLFMNGSKSKIIDINFTQ